MSNDTPTSRRVGRPKDEGNDDRRARLIAAAGPIFSRQGFGATKISDLATAAGVTPAMVHYYFGGKEKLLEAVFDAAFAPLIENLNTPSTLEEWVTIFHGHIMRTRWMPHLMLREVIMDGGHLRDHFRTTLAPYLAQRWIGLMLGEKEAGRLREDANEFRHSLILMGMLIYPFVVAPAGGEIIGAGFSDDDMIAFRDDAMRLFFMGAGG